MSEAIETAREAAFGEGFDVGVEASKEAIDILRSRVGELESALREALDYIDSPTEDIPGPTLIVLAGRKLLDHPKG